MKAKNPFLFHLRPTPTLQSRPLTGVLCLEARLNNLINNKDHVWHLYNYRNVVDSLRTSTEQLAVSMLSFSF